MIHDISISPYGSWKSPITEEVVVQGSVRLSDLSVRGDEVLWVEGRPQEKGRSVIVSKSHGKIKDAIPAEYNVRSTVHEYGGSSYAVHGDDIYFIHYKDQHLYRINREGSIELIIDHPNRRFASFTLSPDGNYLYSVMEDHSNKDHTENSLVCINTKKKTVQIITSGYDFYADPVLSSDGRHIAWTAWNQPNMPWDGTDLYMAEIHDQGLLEYQRKVAGGKNISIAMPLFSPAGILYYVSDETGFWNFYTYEKGETKLLCQMNADIAEPMWSLGMKRAAFVSYKGKTALALIYTEEAIDRLGVIDLEKKRLETIDTPFTSLQSLKAYKHGVIFIGASPTTFLNISYVDLETNLTETVFASDPPPIDPKFFSIPIPIKYKTGEDEEAHAIYYPPSNPYFQSSPSQKTPPLIVRCHGGPTGHKKAVLDLTHQYWTSRGFAVVEVNYRGSSGYGRRYRELLDGNWGIADVEDAIYAAKYLVEQNLANQDQVAIVGGSAGGYTVLAALTFQNFFKAGVSYYGVSDLEALVKDTHKFEAHYLDKLIGKYPEDLPLYKERSPIHHIDRINTPLLLLQGGEDRVVPPSQSEMVYQALQKKGVPTSYILFPNEQHGFRSKDAIMTSLKSEYAFYLKTFGID